MRSEDIPKLEGWYTFSEAAEILKVSKQGLHKMVFEAEAFSTVHKLGSKPTYIIHENEVNDIAEKRGKKHGNDANK